MTDEIDRAQHEVERLLGAAQRVRKPAGPQPTGRCHFCDEIVDDQARFCGPDCRDGWEREQKRRAA